MLRNHHSLRELDRLVLNRIEKLIMVAPLEWSFPIQEVVEDDPNRPHVELLRVVDNS